ncbi:MAG: HIT domain-containing protein [Patescibacteria group bacterium]
MDCIFCKIIANEIPSYTVYEDEHTRAFLDIFGATDGHTMVVHKRHEETIVGYSDQEISDVFKTVKKVVTAIEKAFDTKILSIGLNHGEPQGVHHMHVHIMPRFEGDGGGIIQQLPKRKLVKKDFGKIVSNIKKKLV